MTKRLLALFLLCILAIPIFTVSVYADGYIPYIDLKADGYVFIDSKFDTDFSAVVQSNGDPVTVQFPVEFTGQSSYVELVVESSGTFSITHFGSNSNLNMTSLGNNLYLYRGSVGSSLDETFLFNASPGTSFTIHKARYYPSFTTGTSALFSTGITWNADTFTQSAASSVSVSRTPEAIADNVVADWTGENYVVSALVSDVYAKLIFSAAELRGYDFLTIHFYVQDWALESVSCDVGEQPLDVRLSGFNVDDVDTSVYGTGWTYNKSRYTIDIDLRSIPYNNTEAIDVWLSGHMVMQANDYEGSRLYGKFYFSVPEAIKYITVEQPDSQLGLLGNIWQSIQDLSSNLLRLFEDNEEIIDDFRDEQAKDETKVDEFIDVIETTPTVNLDDVDDLVKPLDDLEIDTNYTTVLAGTLDGDFGTYLILFPVILAVIGYILYGKR